jgi:hypothetical protein
MPLVSATATITGQTVMHAEATLLLSVIRLSPTDKGLKWDALDGNGEVELISLPSSEMLELLSQKYGAMRQPNGNYHLYVSQADKLINQFLPYVKEEELPGWGELSQQVQSKVSKRRVPEKFFPTDFNEKLAYALRQLEEDQLRLSASVSARALSSAVNQPTPEPQPCPYDLSGLTTVLQRERFDYVYANRPTIQAIRDDLQVTPSSWRVFVHNSLRDKLKDCRIGYNPTDSVWEVVPIVMNL